MRESREIKRLLFVDDERSILDGFRRSYRGLREEYEMFFAESGEEALRLVGERSMDVVVSDMRMPAMDGAELMAQIAQRAPDTIRIILTGQSDREASLRGLRVTHQFLSKPCGVQELKDVIDHALAVRQRIQNPAIKTVVSGITRLPSPPRLVNELVEALQLPNPSAEHVAEIVSSDIALTAEILKIANSAFMGFNTRISSAKDAAVLLGLDVVKSIALYFSVRHSVPAAAQVKGLSLEVIFYHSLRVAALARHLVELESSSPQEQQDAFTAGLLHDIGKLLILQSPGMYGTLLPLEPGVRLHEAEEAKFGCTHAEVGAYALALWGLPLALVETTAFHHRPAESPTRPNLLLAAVHVANVWDHDFTPTRNPEIDLEFLESCDLASRLPTWTQATAAWLSF